MGSFNVACSISNISIGPSDKIVFIPLVIKHYSLGRKYRNLSIPSQYIIYPNDFFSPICLPIRCKYDDYGGIEDVIKDDNTKCIEDFLGFPVEELPAHIQRKGVYDYFSATSKKFLPLIEELSNYESGLDENFLKLFGFKHIGTLILNDNEEKIYEYSEKILPFFVSVTNNRIYITNNDGEIFSSYDISNKNISSQFKQNFLNDFSSVANYYIGVNEENQDIVRLLLNMSGMFVHAEIYDTLNKESYGESYGKKYSDILDEYIKVLQEGLSKEEMSKEKRAIQRWKEIEKATFVADWHQDWYKFKEIFTEALREGKLRNDFVTYSIFSSNMYATNKFYFPAMNGEQCGNDKASLILAEKIVDILKVNIKKYAEEYEDEEFEDD